MVQMEPRAGEILLVEDDNSLGAILTAVLQDQGYTIVRAANGKEALDCLRAGRPPHLILLNLVMPVMNGWKFREQLKKIPELAEIPVIVLSGVRKLDQTAASLDVTESFPKPFNLKAVLDAIQHYCPQSGQTGAGTAAGQQRCDRSAAPK